MTASTKPLWKQLDEQYKKSRTAWRKQSVAFCSKSPRLESPRAVSTQADYDTTKPMGAGRPAKATSAWAKNKVPQREPIKAPTDLMYDPPVFADKRNNATTLSSRVARLEEIPEMDKGQQELSPMRVSLEKTAGAPSKNPYLLTYRSKGPQSSKVIPANDTTQETTSGTIEAAAAKGKSCKSPWAKNKSIQRPLVKAPTDLMYDSVPVSARSVHDTSSFCSRTPRLPASPDAAAPPVGTYDSPFIASGMMY